jgi:ubiquitin-protein ligase
MPFPGLWGSFDRILIVKKQRFCMSNFEICLKFSSTKWVKAYLINYILEKLQESMGNMILCSLPWIMCHLKLINNCQYFKDSMIKVCMILKKE